MTEKEITEKSPKFKIGQIVKYKYLKYTYRICSIGVSKVDNVKDDYFEFHYGVVKSDTKQKEWWNLFAQIAVLESNLMEMKPIFEMEYMGKLCSYQAGCNLTTAAGARRVRRFPTPRVDNFKKSIYCTALAERNRLWYLRGNKFPLTGRLSIETTLIYSRRIDPDNITKIIYDALQGVIYVDDFQLKHRLIEVDDVKGKSEGFILKVFQI